MTDDVILITGGAGFIGCSLAASLGRDFGKIVAVDNLHPQIHLTQSRPKTLPDHVELIVGDVRDRGLWAKFLAERRPRVIVHLAAETGTGQSLTDAGRHASVNVVGTAELLDALTAAKVKPDHILLASSRAVYGEGAWRSADGAVFYPGRRSHAQLARQQWNLKDAEGRFGEPVPHRASEVHALPSSIYGATKLAQEHILTAWTSAMDVPLSILRLQNVYGPGQSPFNAYTGIVVLFHRVARAGKAIEVYEDGRIGRDFVFISDVAQAFKRALGKVPTGVRILDVGSGTATTILDAARQISALHGAPAPVICGKYRDGDVRWAVSNPEDAERELGAKATVGFADGSAMVSEWLAAQGYI